MLTERIIDRKRSSTDYQNTSDLGDPGRPMVTNHPEHLSDWLSAAYFKLFGLALTYSKLWNLEASIEENSKFELQTFQRTSRNSNSILWENVQLIAELTGVFLCKLISFFKL